MDNAIQAIVQTFEGLIRRGFAPSMTFFVVLVLGELIRAELLDHSARALFAEYVHYLATTSFPSASVVILLFILMAIGFSYALGAIQQLLFDNMLKRNFDPATRFSRSSASEAQALKLLRDRVKERLNTELMLVELWRFEELTDYVLYEILGGIDPVDTRGFVDSAKAMGIVCVSIILVLLGNILVHHEQLGPWVAPLLLLVVLFYWWGREATVSQYRARALRLYVNFLAMPTERIHRRLLRPGEDPTPTSPSQSPSPP